MVTAGGTREKLDPIRYLGNRSSGQMGYALTLDARDRGAEVSLVSTIRMAHMTGVDQITVETADEMHRTVMSLLPNTDVLIMAAAVADYHPTRPVDQKIKKADTCW